MLQSKSIYLQEFYFKMKKNHLMVKHPVLVGRLTQALVINAHSWWPNPIFGHLFAPNSQPEPKQNMYKQQKIYKVPGPRVCETKIYVTSNLFQQLVLGSFYKILGDFVGQAVSQLCHNEGRLEFGISFQGLYCSRPFDDNKTFEKRCYSYTTIQCAHWGRFVSRV